MDFIFAVILLLNGAALSTLLLGSLSSRAHLSSETPFDPATEEATFRNAFLLLTDFHRAELLDAYMRFHSCGRRQAIGIALADKVDDDREWETTAHISTENADAHQGVG
jgi:hypothetical protein